MPIKSKKQQTVVADKPAEIVQEVEAEVSSGESTIQNEGFSGIQEITEEEEEKEIKESKRSCKES